MFSPRTQKVVRKATMKLFVSDDEYDDVLSVSWCEQSRDVPERMFHRRLLDRVVSFWSPEEE